METVNPAEVSLRAQSESRLARLEVNVHNAQTEIDAMSVLVLALDTAWVLGGDRRSQEMHTVEIKKETKTESIEQPCATNAETAQIASRMEALEKAWAYRNADRIALGEETALRLENEILDVWKVIRETETRRADNEGQVRNGLSDMQTGLSKLTEDFEGLQKKLLLEQQKQLDDFIAKRVYDLVQARIGDTTIQFAQRCTSLEDKMGFFSGMDSMYQADRQRMETIQQSLELLLQQRALDAQAVDRQFRDVEHRVNKREQLVDPIYWENQFGTVKEEIENLRQAIIPSAVLQSAQASQALADGWHFMRQELLDLRRSHEVACQQFVIESTRKTEVDADLAALREDMVEVRRHLAHVVGGELEERLSATRTAINSEIAVMRRELAEAASDASRRVDTIEAISGSRNEIRIIHVDGPPRSDTVKRSSSPPTGARRNRKSKIWKPTKDVNGRILENQDPALALQFSKLGKELSMAADTDAQADTDETKHGSKHRDLTLKIFGRMAEWPLLRNQMQMAGIKPMMSETVEIMGIEFRLKFFPQGSPLHEHKGHCSLYMRTVTPATIRFRLHAGDHTSALLDATSERMAKDLGKHDLCVFQDVVDQNGDVTVGCELVEVKLIDAL